MNAYLYTSPKLTVYNGRLSKICHVFASMQPSSSTGPHVSSNNSLILSICTSFNCLEKKLGTLSFTKSQTPINPLVFNCLQFDQSWYYFSQMKFIEISTVVTNHFDFLAIKPLSHETYHIFIINVLCRKYEVTNSPPKCHVSILNKKRKVSFFKVFSTLFKLFRWRRRHHYRFNEKCHFP